MDHKRKSQHTGSHKQNLIFRPVRPLGFVGFPVLRAVEVVAQVGEPQQRTASRAQWGIVVVVVLGRDHE